MNRSNKKIFIANDTTVIVDLHSYELQLIKAIREKWRFGEITILVRDGLPYRIKRVQEFDDFED